MSIEVAAVRGRRDLMRFIRLPHDLHGDDPAYVPQLDLLQREALGPGAAFRQHAEMELFLARRRGRVVGRIAAIANHGYDAHHGARQGWFGFFACADDPAATEALLAACRTWLAARGQSGLLGPVNPDLNSGCGVVVTGHGCRPMVFMPWNPPYYADLLAAAGLVPVQHLNAWEIRTDGVPDWVAPYAARLRPRLEAGGYELRPIDLKNFAAEAAALRAVYNDALAGSWGHTPLSAEEFAEQARGLRLICPPELIQVAVHDGRIVGFIGAAPDLNEVLVRIPRGRLLPRGWWRLLTGRRRIRWSRVVMYGVARDHRGSSLAVWLYLALILAVKARGLAGAEASYVLADNRPVNDLSARIGGVLRKRYAIYGLPADREGRDGDRV